MLNVFFKFNLSKHTAAWTRSHLRTCVRRNDECVMFRRMFSDRSEPIWVNWSFWKFVRHTPTTHPPGLIFHYQDCAISALQPPWTRIREPTHVLFGRDQCFSFDPVIPLRTHGLSPSQRLISLSTFFAHTTQENFFEKWGGTRGTKFRSSFPTLIWDLRTESPSAWNLKR